MVEALFREAPDIRRWTELFSGPEATDGLQERAILAGPPSFPVPDAAKKVLECLSSSEPEVRRAAIRFLPHVPNLAAPPTDAVEPGKTGDDPARRRGRRRHGRS